MTKYEPVIGLEVHVELNTKSKMFCRCSADYFGKEPNTHTCPTCLGLPGALPYINEAAIDDCMKIGLALNCKISKKSLFERKNYFYPDLSKGYQISQYRWPLCVNGQLAMDNGRVIRINRVHQEEDTGKLTHKGKDTLIDFNRSGVPLVEIVTEPDFKEVEEIRNYAKKLQQLFRYLGVSNADMERGDMRLEANISVRPIGQTELPSYRVELKNINSFRFMVAAVEYEIKRQITALEAGEKISQETRGWNEDKKCTYLQRSKENAHDYRYFPEPDLPELRIEESRVRDLESGLPELPWDKAKRFEEEYGLNGEIARVITQDRESAEKFEEIFLAAKNKQIKAMQIINHLRTKLKYEILELDVEQVVNDLAKKDSELITKEANLEILAKQVIEENKKSADDYKKGKVAAIQVLIGGVMKLSKGKADAEKTKTILEKLLKP